MRTLQWNSAQRALGVLAVLTVGAACADKAFTPNATAINPHLKLMVMANTAQQVAPSARYVWVGVAAIIPGGDTGLLAMNSVRVTGSTQTIPLEVDISRCLSATSANGGSGCSIIVAAILRADSLSPTDTSEMDPFVQAFDYAVAGPFEVGNGRVPVIPTINLSVSRFSVFDWMQDDALRLGAAQNIVNTGGTPLGRVLSGITSGAGDPVLYSVTQGGEFVSQPSQGQNQFQVYPALAIFEGGKWRRLLAKSAPPINTVNPNLVQGFMDVTALATNDVYIAATTGLYKFDGTAFAKISNVTDSVYSVGSVPTAGGRLVIAGGMGGIVWIGYGTSWQKYTTGSNSRFDGVCINSASEAFASSSVTGALYRFNGTTWTSVPASSTAGKIDLQCVGGQAYVTASGFGFFRWNGSSWTQLSGSGLSASRQPRMSAVSASEIYAAGDSGNTDRAFYRYDGTSWTEIGRRRFSLSPIRLWADPRGGAAYVLSSYGRLEKTTPASVSVLSYQPGLHDAIMTSATSAFVVGTNVFLARWDGLRWTIDNPPAGTPATRVLQGVWSDGPSNAWAVGNGSTILRYTGKEWAVVSDVNRPIATPDNYNGAWGSGSDVWVAGETTLLRCKATTTCVVENSGGGTLYSVWGSSASNIFAVGAGGRVLRYNGTSWTAMNSPTSRALARVHGSGPNDVWAVGDSVLMHYDGTQWTTTPVTGNLSNMKWRVPSFLAGVFHLGLWVRGPKEAYAGGDDGLVSRWDGSGWTETRVGFNFGSRRILSITGASGCAMALAEGQTDNPAPTVWRGLGTDGCMASPMGAPASWP